MEYQHSSKYCHHVGQLLVCLLVGVGVTTEAYSSPLNRRKIFDVAASHVLLGSGLVLPSSVSATEGPTPFVEIPITTLTGKTSSISIPRVGYSLYKTEAEQVPLCVELALAAGVKHIDVASQYGTNDLVGKVLKSYISKGQEGVPDQPSTKLGRRQELFVSHKLSNHEQSDQIGAVKKAVKKQLKSLQLNYLDLCSIHSPLTSPSHRLGSYNALLELQKDGLVRAVGVCNYGVNPLEEIIKGNLPAPTVNQLILSPFNQHKDVVEWARTHGTLLCCSAWSRLSSADGPQEGWAVLADVAKTKGLTKAQVLVRWAVQKGYLSVPRSGSKYKIEREAIRENSFDGTKNVVLTEKEIEILDGLDERLPAGKLGIVDGWTKDDILNATWDPTLAV